MNNHALPITMINKQGPSQLLFVDTLMAIVIAYVCLPNSTYCPRFMSIETKRHPRGTIKRRKNKITSSFQYIKYIFLHQCHMANICFHNASCISQLLVKHATITIRPSTRLRLCVCFKDATNFRNVD